MLLSLVLISQHYVVVVYVVWTLEFKLRLLVNVCVFNHIVLLFVVNVGKVWIDLILDYRGLRPRTPDLNRCLIDLEMLSVSPVIIGTLLYPLELCVL